MEIGFNFSTHKVEKMYNYEVLTTSFNYQKDYLEQELNTAAENLQTFFEEVISTNLIPKTNYSIVLLLESDEELEREDYFSVFSTFAFVAATHGADNNKGYLKVKPEIAERVSGAQFSLLNIMNRNYEFGIIQLTIVDSKGYESKWVN